MNPKYPQPRHHQLSSSHYTSKQNGTCRKILICFYNSPQNVYSTQTGTRSYKRVFVHFFVQHDLLENINFLSHLSQEKKKKLQKIIYNSPSYCRGGRKLLVCPLLNLNVHKMFNGEKKRKIHPISFGSFEFALYFPVCWGLFTETYTWAPPSTTFAPRHQMVWPRLLQSQLPLSPSVLRIIES